jgi:hypothetical protein
MREQMKSTTWKVVPLAAVALTALLCLVVRAQEEPSPPPPADEETATATDAAETAPGDEAAPAEETGAAGPQGAEGTGYNDNPAGRRDPFKSLLEKSTAKGGKRPEGLPGMQVNEVDVLGTVRRQDGSYQAIIQGADKLTYTIHPGDRLFDGQVEAILADRVIFQQRIDDPSIPREFRRVEVLMNPNEEGNR